MGYVVDMNIPTVHVVNMAGKGSGLVAGGNTRGLSHSGGELWRHAGIMRSSKAEAWVFR